MIPDTVEGWVFVAVFFAACEAVDYVRKTRRATGTTEGDTDAAPLHPRRQRPGLP